MTKEQIEIIDELRMYMATVTPKNPLVIIDEFVIMKGVKNDSDRTTNESNGRFLRE